MRFSEKLKDLRLQHGMSQESFAKRVGVSKSVIGHWENERIFPRVEQVMKIANSFGIEWTELLDDDVVNKQHAATKRDGEQTLIDSYRSLNDEGKQMLLTFAQSLVYNPQYGPATSSFKDAMLYDGAKDQKTLEEMTAEELRRLADEKES